MIGPLVDRLADLIMSVEPSEWDQQLLDDVEAAKVELLAITAGISDAYETWSTYTSAEDDSLSEEIENLQTGDISTKTSDINT